MACCRCRRDVGPQRRPGRPGGLAERRVPAAGHARLGAERGRGAQRRPDHSRRRWNGSGPGLDLPAGRAVGPATGGRRHRSRIRDRRGADPHAHGPHWRAARRRGEGAAASGPADPCGGRRGQVLGSRPISPASPCRQGFPDALRRAAKQFVSGVPQPTADVRGRVRGGAGGGRPVAPAATPPGTAWFAWRPAAIV